MKFTTARRIIKEVKRGKQHPQDLIDRAHAICHQHHDAISREKAAQAEVIGHIKSLEEKMTQLPEEKRLRVIPDGMTPEQFAERQVRLGRQGRLRSTKPSMEVDAMGNESLREVKERQAFKKIEASAK